MLPIVALLAEQGLSMLGNAILNKGKEKVEEIIGTKIPDTPAGLTPEITAKLRELEFKHEEALLELGINKAKVDLELEKVAGEAVSKRWEADMLSDSWLSKNIRPLALITGFGTFLVFSVLSMFGVLVGEGYVSMLESLLQVMVGAYFVGRTVEKSVDIHAGWKNTKGE